MRSAPSQLIVQNLILPNAKRVVAVDPPFIPRAGKAQDVGGAGQFEQGPDLPSRRVSDTGSRGAGYRRAGRHGGDEFAILLRDIS